MIVSARINSRRLFMTTPKRLFRTTRRLRMLFASNWGRTRTKFTSSVTSMMTIRSMPYSRRVCDSSIFTNRTAKTRIPFSQSLISMTPSPRRSSPLKKTAKPNTKQLNVTSRALLFDYKKYCRHRDFLFRCLDLLRLDCGCGNQILICK